MTITARRVPTIGALAPYAFATDRSTSANSGTGKALRWFLEREAGPWLADQTSRNNILNEPSAIFANRAQDTTDILHEYFVPQARLWEFVGHAKEIIRREKGNLLNVTVRDVRRDTRSVS